MSCGCTSKTSCNTKDCSNCVEVIEKCPKVPEAVLSPVVSWCGNNGSYTWDGTKVSFTPSATPIPDGSYTSITLTGGCISGVGQVTMPTYTPSECCAPPSGGGGDVTTVDISTVTCNLLQEYPDGLYAGLTIQSGANTTVTGCGTVTDPLIISSTASGSGGSQYTASSTSGNLIAVDNTNSKLTVVVNVQDSDTVVHSGDGSDANPFYFELAPGAFVENITSSYMLITEPVANNIVIEHPKTNLAATYDARYNLTFDDKGHLSAVTLKDTIAAAPFTIKAPVPSGGFQLITYDEYGIITNVTFSPT